MGSWPRILRYVVAPVLLIGIVIGIFLLSEKRYTIVPSAVAGDRTGAHASFKVVRTKVINLGSFPNVLLISNGIPTDFGGGACMIFPAKDLGFNEMGKIKNCTTSESCETGEGAGAYCEVKTGQCWSKPANIPGLCRRTIDPGEVAAWTVDADNQIPKTGTTPLNSFPLKPNTQVRLLACLRGIGLGCGVKGSLEVWGPSTPLP